MKSATLFLLCVLLGFGAPPAALARDAFPATVSAPAQAAAGLAFAAKLDQALDALIQEDRLVGAVLLVSQDGRLIYHRAAGFADRERRRPMQENTLFRLSSVSKPFTVLAAAVLIDRGILRLDDPVHRWLPNFTPKEPDGQIAGLRIRHLMSHTSGLGYPFDEAPGGPYRRAGVSDGLDDSPVSLAENLRRMASVPLLFAPGSGWHYSLGIDVLGRVVEKATGKPLPEAMRELVLQPLAPHGSAFSIDAAKASRLAKPYHNVPSGLPQPIADGQPVNLGHGMQLRFSLARAFDASAYPSGGAGMVGCAADVMRVLEAIRGAPFQGKRLVSEATLKTLRAQQSANDAVAPGWGFATFGAILENPEKAHSPQSAGTLAWGGVYGHAWFIDPARRLSVVLLTNTTPAGISGNVAMDALRKAIYESLPRE
jgi:CubicO group peptidase (beta-lactamase class C family)